MLYRNIIYLILVEYPKTIMESGILYGVWFAMCNVFTLIEEKRLCKSIDVFINSDLCLYLGIPTLILLTLVFIGLLIDVTLEAITEYRKDKYRI